MFKSIQQPTILSNSNVCQSVVIQSHCYNGTIKQQLLNLLTRAPKLRQKQQNSHLTMSIQSVYYTRHFQVEHSNIAVNRLGPEIKYKLLQKTKQKNIQNK